MTEKTIVGLLEDVVVKGNNGKTRTLKARIDTGATKSSIDKSIVEELELGPVIRRRMTRQASGVTWRPVIKASIELAGRKFRFQFTIADRSEMTYKILIGQNILKRNFLVDPSK
ncbi:MAG: RimK/LysX family protein [Nanobdellota archaeon]